MLGHRSYSDACAWRTSPQWDLASASPLWLLRGRWNSVRKRRHNALRLAAQSGAVPIRPLVNLAIALKLMFCGLWAFALAVFLTKPR